MQTFLPLAKCAKVLDNRRHGWADYGSEICAEWIPIHYLPRLTKRGLRDRHIIAYAQDDKYIYRLHATKGWRRQRL